MNILHIVISKGWHAQTANACLIIKHQIKSGDSIDLCCLEGSRIHRALAEIGGRTKTFKHYYNPSLISILKQMLINQNYHAIHLHGYNGKSRLWMALKLSGKKIPVVCSSRERPREIFFFRKLFWNHFYKILVPNQLVKQQLEQAIGHKKSICILLPLVNTDVFVPLVDKNNKTIKIGMIARFDKVKGFPVFFDACQKLIQSSPDIPIEIVIGGSNFHNFELELTGMLVKYGLKDRTIRLGHIPNIHEEIAKLDIGVIASNGSERLSRIALEYMACGVPVVSTDVGGLPELISPGIGRIVTKNSPDKLKEAMEEFIRDPNLRREAGNLARQTAEKRYSVNAHCQELKEILSQVAPL